VVALCAKELCNMNDIVGTAARRAPELGERTDKVLEELGFTAAEIEALRTGGAIPKAALHTTARA
jgi:crotonobetainyl-CoA:carnitine CoA-transferase CaiB-like acyl-CoA transferase